MKAPYKNYEDFNIGDCVSFKKIYTNADFEIFKALSGDNNPLHHDSDYANSTSFKRPIVPMHLASLPFSAIAGMIFPGQSALYLKSTIRSLSPIYYGDELDYSSSIVAKQDTKQTLTLRTLVSCEKDVLIECEQLVQVRDDVAIISDSNGHKVELISNEPEFVLITGGLGEIAYSLAKRLLQNNKNVVLCFRSKWTKEHLLRDLLEISDYQNLLLHYYEVDLLDQDKWKECLFDIVQKYSISHFVHAASAALDDSLRNLMRTNFEALKQAGDVLIPHMLCKQSGRIIFLGSTAVQHYIEGWENYIGAKVAGTNYVSGVDNHYSSYGIAGTTVALSYVETDFSAKVRPENIIPLLPEQAAEAILNIMFSPQVKNYVNLTAQDQTTGNFGYTVEMPNKVNSKNVNLFPVEKTVAFKEKSNNSIELEALFSEFFNLEDSYLLENASMDTLNDWDSLKHIELLTFLEQEMQIHFTAHEIDKTKSFNGLRKILSTKC